MTVEEEEATRARVEKLFRDVDTVDLDLHLLLPEREARSGSLHKHTYLPMRLPLPQMFRLLETEEGRALCRLLPHIQIRDLPKRLELRHELQVIQLFYIHGGSEPPHLRFVVEDHVEVRYDRHSELIISGAHGIEIFKTAAPWLA